MLLFTTAFIFATLGPMTNGQYFGRPFQMAIQNGFSPYHPARINHETLPISQAEFAQLVAESMATSHGPHHHHPPNTDADYEGPGHAARDAEMLRSASGESNYDNYQQNPQSQHHHHSAHHAHHAQYQPDDHYHENDESYHRSPVFEQARTHKNDEQYKQHKQNEPQEEEEDDEEGGEIEQYGGRPTSDYQAISAFKSQRNNYINNYDENHPNSRDQYMSASDHMPIKIIPLKH